MSSLHQIQLRYDAVEDRALMRVSTTGADEFRFWLTRRFALLLRRTLDGHLTQRSRATLQVPAPERGALLDFQRDAALAEADFDSDFVSDAQRSMPLGEDPVLLARVALRRDGAQSVLSLHPLKGQGIEMRLDERMIHSLLKLLSDAGRRGDWGLPAPAAPVTAAPSRMN